MPISCPIPFGETRDCLECRHQKHYDDDSCRYYSYPILLVEILTTEERLDYRLRKTGAGITESRMAAVEAALARMKSQPNQGRDYF